METPEGATAEDEIFSCFILQLLSSLENTSINIQSLKLPS